uniref:Uncharacterized protein n=1 Tax=Ananas comosus var. bracteatus TaxID=296719 RepID=A0A6V7QMA5_ANACO|nr:unnamed protein product [Ananas comosus var. bracteatus]
MVVRYLSSRTVKTKSSTVSTASKRFDSWCPRSQIRILVDFHSQLSLFLKEINEYYLYCEIPGVLLLRFPASTVGVSTRTRCRSVGLQRNLVRWIQDFERNPEAQLDYWTGRISVDPTGCSTVERVLCCQGLVLESLIELDRDTLHTRLGSSHECHSGDGRCVFALCRGSWIVPTGRDGCIHSPWGGYNYRFVYRKNSFVYGGFVGVPGERVIRGVTCTLHSGSISYTLFI